MKNFQKMAMVMMVMAAFFLAGCAGFLTEKVTGLPSEPDNPSVAQEMGQKYVVNQNKPVVKWQPGPEEISRVAGKGWLYDDENPSAVRLELVVYGGDREKVRDPAWFQEWFYNKQNIVEPEAVEKFFQGFDPNAVTWDTNGNGGYTFWGKKIPTVTLDISPPPSVEEN